MTRTVRTTFGVIAVTLLLAGAELHHFLLFSSPHLGLNLEAAIGVTTGHPHWRVYQNRILGPFLLKGVAGLLTGNDGNAYLLLAFASLALAGYQAWRIGSRIGGGQTGWFALLTLHLAFVFLRQNPFLYVWDYIDLNVFLAFVALVVESATWPWFAALFAVAIVNRESGLFIAFWMAIEPIWRWQLRRPLPPRSAWRMMAAGLTCVVGGAWLVEYLRTTLMVEEVGPAAFRIAPGYSPYVFWNLPFNLSYIRHATHEGLTVTLTAAKGLLLLASLMGLVVELVWIDAARFAALSTTVLALAASIVVFAQISETRVFIDTIPFLLLGTCLLHRSLQRGPQVSPVDK